MKTKTEMKESKVTSRDVVTFKPPAKVNLPKLANKKTITSSVSVEGLPGMAKRISEITPTEEPEKKVDDHPIKETRASRDKPGVEPKKEPETIAYEIPEEAFD